MMMATRYTLVFLSMWVTVLVAAVVVAIGWTAHELRLLLVGVTVGTTSAFSSVFVWAFGRVKCMLDVYRLGYRQGRRDANAKLFEDGVWLSEKAEADARAAYDDDDEDGFPV